VDHAVFDRDYKTTGGGDEDMTAKTEEEKGACGQKRQEQREKELPNVL